MLVGGFALPCFVLSGEKVMFDMDLFICLFIQIDSKFFKITKKTSYVRGKVYVYLHAWLEKSLVFPS